MDQVNQATLDRQLLEDAEKRKKQLKEDSRTVDKIENLDDKKVDTKIKETSALLRTEQSRLYWEGRIEEQEAKRDKDREQIQNYFEVRIQGLKNKYETELKHIENKREEQLKKADLDYEKAISFYARNLNNTNTQKAVVQQVFQTQRDKVERKKVKLSDSIKSVKIKKEAEKLLEKESSSDTESSVESVKQKQPAKKAVKKPDPEPEPEPEPESESESEQEAPPPPPRTYKMAAKQVGVKSQGQQNPKIITNTKLVKLPEDHQQQVEEFAKREEAKSKEAVMRDLYTKIGVEKNILGVLTRQAKPDPDAIHQKKMEIEMLEHKYNTLNSQIPSYYR